MICFVLLHFAIFSVSATHLLSSTMHQSSKTGKSSTIYPVFLWCNETNSGFRFSTVFQKASLRSHIGPMANSHEFWILHKKRQGRPPLEQPFSLRGTWFSQEETFDVLVLLFYLVGIAKQDSLSKV